MARAYRHGVVKESPGESKDQKRNLADMEVHKWAFVRARPGGEEERMMNAPAPLLGFRRCLSDSKAF